jgi:hypothetical protein
MPVARDMHRLTFSCLLRPGKLLAITPSASQVDTDGRAMFETCTGSSVVVVPPVSPSRTSDTKRPSL